jgi:hypothetical protein
MRIDNLPEFRRFDSASAFGEVRLLDRPQLTFEDFIQKVD